MNVGRRATAVGFLLALGLVSGGCGQSPTSPGEQPMASGASSRPPVVAFAPDGSLGYVWAPVAPRGGDTHLAGTITPRLLMSTGAIDGARGGTVRAGRFSVKLPAGAFTGIGVVTLTMNDSTVMICDLAISPQGSNKFKIPAQLTADLSAPAVDAANFTMYWYDPAKANWVNLFADSKVSGTNVTTSLAHFSTYAAGKAGW